MLHIPIKFETKNDKRAHQYWLDAMEHLGGNTLASSITGIRQSYLSRITHGFTIQPGEDYRRQSFPTPEQAMIVSIATNGSVTAEDLLPKYDFSYVYNYVKMRKRK